MLTQDFTQIIGEKGCWVSHFWESPSFLTEDDAKFQDWVIESINNGDGEVMPSPFAAGGQTNPIPQLADGETGFRPEIFISTPEGPNGLLYEARVALIEQALTGEGRAFAGITPKRRGYRKLEKIDRYKAAGKILIQYTNNEEDDMGNQLCTPQGALYRVYFEDQRMSEHRWAAAGAQIAAGTGNQKRQAEACELRGSATGTQTETGGTNTGTGTQTGTGANTGTETGATNTDTGTITGMETGGPTAEPTVSSLNV